MSRKLERNPIRFDHPSNSPPAGWDPRVHVFVGKRREQKTWMPTDQVRGLKAHGSSPAKVIQESDSTWPDTAQGGQ